jgi:hypothetical protein
MICVAPPPDSASRPPRAPYRANGERPLWFVRTTRSGEEWARCDAGRRLDVETADLLLDHVFEQLTARATADGLACLVDGLGHLCETGDRACWRRFAREKWSIHPLSSLLWQTRVRAAAGALPKGGSGFAALMALVGPDFFVAERREAPTRRVAR